ncbi:MAG: hypothetical protein ACTS5I_06655, partial [Rhodanobacter sp.]
MAKSKVAHLSPEEALANIQALLKAKRKRVRKGPAWPDANPAQPASAGTPLSVDGATGGNDAADGRVLVAQRGH